MNNVLLKNKLNTNLCKITDKLEDYSIENIDLTNFYRKQKSKKKYYMLTNNNNLISLFNKFI